MAIVTATCQELHSLPFGRVRARLECATRLQPGQVALWSLPAVDPYAPRTLFPIALHADGFSIELAAGDAARTILEIGKTLSLLLPVGLPFPVRAQRLLLVANVFPERLLPWAQETLAQGGDVALLLGRPYPKEGVPAAVEVRVGALPRLIKEYTNWAEQILIHTDPPDLCDDILRQAQVPVLKLHAPLLPCGFGVCQGCYLPNGKLACLEGLLTRSFVS